MDRDKKETGRKKSTKLQTVSDPRPETLELQPIIEEVWVKQSENIAVTEERTESEYSMGMTAEKQDSNCHINSNFQHDEDVGPCNNISLLMKFGHKGRQLEHFEDATSVKYINSDRLLITDMINNRVVCYKDNGVLDDVFEGTDIKEPWCTTVDKDGRMCITSRKNKDVVVMSFDRQVIMDFGQGYFQRPCGVAITKTGLFVVTDIVAKEVSVHYSNGRIKKCLTVPNSRGEQSFTCPRYVHVNSNGDIIVSDSGEHCIKIFDENGIFKKSFGKYGKEDGKMKSPYGITTDAFGNIIVADHYNDRVSLFSRTGVFICHLVTLNDGIVHPQGIDLSQDLKLLVTHGNLKAFSVSIFQINLDNFYLSN